MPTIFIERGAHKKLKYYVGLCEEEISGFGKIKQIGDNLVITDFQIFKQTVGPAHADMDEDSLAEFLYEKTAAKENLSEWRVWWHSHAKMNAFFSGIDTGTIDESKEFPWLVSLVTNHDGDMVARFDAYSPIRYHLDVEVEVLDEEDEELKEACEKEIEAKVSRSAVRYGYHARPKGKNWYDTHDTEEDDLLDGMGALPPGRA